MGNLFTKPAVHITKRIGIYIYIHIDRELYIHTHLQNIHRTGNPRHYLQRLPPNPSESKMQHNCPSEIDLGLGFQTWFNFLSQDNLKVRTTLTLWAPDGRGLEAWHSWLHAQGLVFS